MKVIRLSAMLILAVIMIAGCGKKLEKQILDLQAKNVELQSQYDRKDSVMNELFTAMNDIERNLADINAREKIIADAPVDEKRLNMDVRDKIMDEIILINNIMEENKKRLASLQEQLRKSNTKVSALEESIKILTAKLEEKEIEIASLKEQLVKLNFTVESLNATVDTLREETASQSKVISQQDAVIGEMNTIWYVIGTKKELSEKGIIEKAGGLFSGNMVMSEMINPGYFTTDDMRKLSRITLDASKAELVTVHPEGTYRFLQEGDMFTGIEIVNPAEFWKSSRFLVVMIK